MARVAVAGLAGLASTIGWVDAAGAQTLPDACDLLTERDARKLLRKPVRRDVDVTGTAATQCGYTVRGDAKRVVGLAVGEFPAGDEAWNAYFRGRYEDRFEGLEIEDVRGIGYRAHWLPSTNNVERTVRGKKLTIGEMTVLDDRFVYTVYVAPPSKHRARDVIEKVIDRRR